MIFRNINAVVGSEYDAAKSVFTFRQMPANEKVTFQE